MNSDGPDQSSFSQTIAFLYGKWAWLKHFTPPSMCFLLSFEHSLQTADKRILSLLSTSRSYQSPFCRNAPSTPGPGEQSCTADKHREVFDNVRRAGWRQDLLFIVALPLGGSCETRWEEAGGWQLRHRLRSWHGCDPRNRHAGSCRVQETKETPKPHRLIRLELLSHVWGSICWVLRTAKVTKSRSPAGSLNKFLLHHTFNKKVQFVFLRNTEDRRK